MSFSDPRWLWGLAGLPLLAALEWLALRRARDQIVRLVGTRVPHPLLARRDPARRGLRAAIVLAALASLLVGAAGPEWGREVVRRSASGSELVFVIDVSASMDSRDVPPSRLAEARREALAVLDRVGDSRVGVVGFAGDAVRLCPLTLDRGAAHLVLESLTSASVSQPGSDLGRALRMAARVMPEGRREEQAVVLWTDGEDLEQGARDAIDQLAGNGIRVFAVGVGTRAGDVVPVLDDQGRATDVKRDESGLAVRSRLDEELLRHLAQRTHGAYFGATRPGGELPRLLWAIGGLSRSSHGMRLAEQPVPRFPLFAAIAAALVLFDLAWPWRRPEAAPELAPALQAERRVAAAAVALALVLALTGDAAAQSAWARGDQALRDGRYADAESLYTLRLRHRSPDAVRVNRATAAALRGPGTSPSDPEAELGRAAARPGPAGQTAGYNLGTLLGGRREYDPALAMLRKAIERDPRDVDAGWNYEFLLQRRQEEENPSQNQAPQQKNRPQPNGGSGGGNPQPQPSAPSAANPTPSSGTPSPGPSSPSMKRSEGMDREQAERLLGALQDLERLEQQRRRQVRVMRERHGKDW